MARISLERLPFGTKSRETKTGADAPEKSTGSARTLTGASVMKGSVFTIAMGFLLFAVGPRAHAQAHARCEIHASQGLAVLEEGRLSSLWALEAVGADLAKEELSRWTATRPASAPISVAVVDDGINASLLSSLLCPDAILAEGVKANRAKVQAHGFSVSRLIVDPQFGTAGHACLGYLGQVTQGNADRGAAGAAVIAGYDPVFSSNSRILNVSSRLNFAPSAARLNQLADQGRFVVQASGNDFPDFDPVARTMPKVIQVGSLGPDGLVSFFSSEFPEIAILAPSDHALLSTGKVVFSGTSGAAPLVSGALANVLNILPQLRPEAAKVLLAKTAIPTFVQAQGQSEKNGAGMLNAFRLVRAAECLALTHAPIDAASLERETRCFDFSREARTHLARAESMVRSASCENRKQVWRELRASFLLDPLSTTAKRLASFERSVGKTTNSLFYRSFLNDPIEVRAYLKDTAKEVAVSVTPLGYGQTGLYPVVISGASTWTLVSRLDPKSNAAKILREDLVAQTRAGDVGQRLETMDRIAAGGAVNIDLLSNFAGDADESVQEKLATINEQLPRIREWSEDLAAAGLRRK